MNDQGMTHVSERLGKLPVEISVRVCQRKLSLSQFLQWSPGTVVEFDQAATSPLLLQIDHQIVGRGVAVKIGSQMGLCVQTIGGETPNQ